MEKKKLQTFTTVSHNGQIIRWTESEKLNKIDPQTQCPEKLARANAHLGENREQVLKLMEEIRQLQKK